MSFNIEETTNNLSKLSAQLAKKKIPHMFMVDEGNDTCSFQFAGTGQDFIQFLSNAIAQNAQDDGIPASMFIAAIASCLDYDISFKDSH